jgi:hypothetical protein
MSVKCFKLSSGEEIIAETSNETSEFVNINTPVLLVMVGEGQFAMAPWLPLADTQDCIISKKDIIVSYIPRVELANDYKQRTGRIVAAPAGVLNQLERKPQGEGLWYG